MELDLRGSYLAVSGKLMIKNEGLGSFFYNNHSRALHVDTLPIYSSKQVVIDLRSLLPFMDGQT